MEVLNNDELFEEEFDENSFLEISEQIQTEEARTSIINPANIKKLHTCYDMVKKAVSGKKLSVKYFLHEPFNSMGNIKIIGKGIRIKDAGLFTRAAELASNIEVYPKTDGTVCMVFTFHGLTTPIE